MSESYLGLPWFARYIIAFTKAGAFTVLCGIHPKMKLIVTVRE